MTVEVQSPSPAAERCALAELPELVRFFCLDPGDPVCRFLLDEVEGNALIQCLAVGEGYCASVVERSRESRGREGERSFLVAWDDGQALDGALRDPRFTDDPVAIRVWGEWGSERALVFDPKNCPMCAYKGPSKAELLSRGIPKEVEIQNRHVTFDPEKCTISARVEGKGATHKVRPFKLGEAACASEKRYWAEER